MLDLNGNGKLSAYDLTVSQGVNKLPIDANGDYLLDFYSKAYYLAWNGMTPRTENLYQRNEGNGVFTTLPANTYNFPTSQSNVNSYNYDTSIYLPTAKVMDVNSDGLQDIISNNPYSPNPNATGNGVMINNGKGFDASDIYTATIRDAQEMFEDVNGDGMVDRIYADNVYLNNGKGWNGVAGHPTPSIRTLSNF